MLDTAGQVWGQSLERAGNSFERRPPSQWAPGEVVRAEFEVNLNPATPAGDYKLGVIIPGDPGEPLPCGAVEIIK
jgi:hypothetical protein